MFLVVRTVAKLFAYLIYKRIAARLRVQKERIIKLKLGSVRHTVSITQAAGFASEKSEFILPFK